MRSSKRERTYSTRKIAVNRMPGFFLYAFHHGAMSCAYAWGVTEFVIACDHFASS